MQSVQGTEFQAHLESVEHSQQFFGVSQLGKMAKRLRALPMLMGILLALLAVLLIDARGAHAQTVPPAPSAPVCSPGTFELKSSTTLFQDYAETPSPLTSVYVQYQITNTTGTPIQAVRFGVTNTTYITTAVFEDGVYTTTIALGDRASVFFYVRTNDVGGSGNIVPNQLTWLALYDANGTALCQTTQTFTVADAGKNQSNKINLVTATDLGNGCFNLNVIGETGNADFPVIAAVSPAGLDSWPADFLELSGVSASITTTVSGTLTYTDTLLFTDLPDPGGTGWPYAISYKFCVDPTYGKPVTSVIVRPVNYINTGSGLSQSPFDPTTATILFPLVQGLKTDGDVTVIAGARLLYTITLNSIGTISQTNVRITDTVPANTVFTTTGSNPGWSCTGGETAGTPCTLTVGTLPPSTTRIYTYSVIVDPALSLSINLLTNTLVGNPSTIIVTENTPVIRQATVGVTKTDGRTSVTPGQTISYTMVVTSNGPSTLQSGTVSDIIPAALTNISWTSTVSNATTTPDFGNGDINANVVISSGGRITYILTGTVANTATGSLTNTVTLTPPAGLSLTNSITSATDIDAIILTADLVITKTASPTPTVAAGTLLTYTIVAGNNGPSNISGAIINDAFPVTLTNPSWTCEAGGGASCNAPSGTGSLSNVSVTLNAGSLLTFTITGTVNAAATGSLVNTATITVPAGVDDSNSANNTSTAITLIDQRAEVLVDKSGPATAVPGTLITYTVIVTNNGPSLAANVIVSDIVPAAIQGPIWTCTATAGSSCFDASGAAPISTTVTLSPSGAATFVITGTINAAATGLITNTASITSTSDITSGNNTSTVTTTLVPDADVSISKAGPVTVTIGTPVVYTLTVTNLGPSIANEITVTDDTPADLTFVGFGGACTSATCSIPSLNVAGSATVLVTFTIPANYTGTLNITNTAYVTASTFDSNLTNNSATANTSASSLADLYVTKSASSATVTAGTNVTYTIVVTNLGPSDAYTVSVADPIPVPFVPVSVTGDCAGGSFPCDVGYIPLNGTRVITAVYFIPTGYLTPTTVNTVYAQSPTSDIILANNTATATVGITTSADVSITKEGPAVIVPGTDAVFTITVKNLGPSDALSVTVSDAGFNSLISTNTGDCTTAFPCALGTLTNGSVRVIVATFVVPASFTETQIINTATVTTETPDPVSDNNSSSVTVPVVRVVDLDILKSAPATAVAGTQLTYTLVVTNNGPSQATNVTVSDTVPAGLTYTNNDANCTVTGGVLYCTAVSLAPGANQSYNLVFNIASSATGQIGNTASVTSTETPTETTSTVTTTLTAEAELSVIKSGPAVSVAGTSIQYTLAVSNAGPSDMPAGTVSDLFPAALPQGNISWVCTATGGATCNAAGAGNLNETVSMPANSTLLFTVTAVIDSAATGTITNTAQITSVTVMDQNPTNNTDDAVTQLISNADLDIVKSAPATAVAGEQLTYTLVVTNNGPSQATNVTVSDIVPAGLTYTNNDANCTVTGGVLVCNAGTLVVGQSKTFTATFGIDANARGEIGNTAAVTSTETPTETTSTVTTTLTTLAVLSITKDGPATAVAGTQLTYTLIVTNNGPSEAINVTVSDTVPTGLTFVSGTAGCGVNGGVLVCNAGTLAVGGSASFTVTFNIVYYATGDIENTAGVTSTETPTQTTDTVTTTLTSVAVLNITKDAPATAVAGTQLTYTLVVTNNGPSQATNVTVSDTVPSGLTFVSGTAGCNVNGGVLECNVGTLAVNQSKPFTATFNIAANAVGDIENTASVTSTETPTETTDIVTTTLTSVANLSMTKDAPATAVAGEQLTYTLVVTNNGPSQATNVTVSDTVPAGLTFVSGTAGCNVSGGVLNCNAGTLFVNQSKPFTATFNIDANVRGEIGNTAGVTSTETPTETTDIVTTTLTSVANLSITKDAPASAVAGEQLTYTLVVTNNGPSQATNVTVSDTVPAGLTFVSGTVGCGVNSGVLTCNAGTLSVGGSQTFAVVFDIDPATRGEIGNTASVTSTETPTETTDTVTTTVTSVAVLSITKDAPATAVAGTQLTYTLVVTNNGPSQATNVTVSDTVPAGLSYTGNNASCTVTGGVLVCNAGTLAVGQSKSYLVVFDIASMVTGEIGNTAGVTSTETPTETTDTVTTTLTTLVVLSITKDAPATAVAGEQLTYTLIVTNNGPSQATTVTVSDTVPAGLTFVSGTAGCGVNGGVLVCNAGTLAVGQGKTFTATFNIDANVRGEIGNTAAVTSTETPTETTDTVTTTVNALAVLSITKDAPATAIAGTQLTYTLVVTNNGPSQATNVTVSDTVPAGLTFVSVTAGCSVSNGVLSCNAGTLMAGQLQVFTVVFNINPASIGQITNTAGVTSTETPTETTSTVTTTLQSVAVLSITKDAPATAVAGTQLTYTLVVTNNGPSQATNVTVSDTVPAGLSYIGNNANCTLTNGVLVCNAGTLAVNQSQSFSVVFDIDANASGEIGNTASVTSTETPTDTTDIVTTTVTGVTHLGISKVGPAVAVPGGQVSYTVVVTNNGPSNATNVTLTDLDPKGLTPVNSPCVAGVCNVGNLLVGESYTLTLTYNIDAAANGSVTNTALVTSTQWLTPTSAESVTLLSPNAEVFIAKTNNQMIAVPGTTITYEVTIHNTGPSNVTGVVRDVFPFEQLSTPQWSSAGVNGAFVSGSLMDITTPAGVPVVLPAYSVLTLTVAAQLNLTATGLLTNVAEFVMDAGIVANNPITQAIDVDTIVPALVSGQVFNDLNGNGVRDGGEGPLTGVTVRITGNGVSGVDVTVDAAGAFTQVVPPGPFTISVVPSSVSAGFALTTNNAVQNGVAAAGPNVTSAIGYQGRGAVSGVTFNDVNGNGVREVGEVALPNVVVTLATNAVQVAGGEAVITTTSDASGAYSFANVAVGSYTLNAGAPAGYNNTTALPQSVNVQAGAASGVDIGFQAPGVLVITKRAQASGSNNQLGTDRRISYTLSVTNMGGGVLNGVVVTDVLASYLSYVAGSASMAPVTTSPLVWPVGSLQPGASVTIGFVVVVDASYTGAATNVAQVASVETAPGTSNVVVVQPAPTAITLVRFEAQRGVNGVSVSWETGLERNTYGFNLYRSATGNRVDAIQVNATLIGAGAKGGQYGYEDAGAEATTTYTYWLEEIEVDGRVNAYADTAVVTGSGSQGVTTYRVFVPVLLK